MKSKPYAPSGSHCGELIRLRHRDFAVVWRRDMTGPTNVTGKSVNRGHCAGDPKYLRELTDDLHMVVCGRHSERSVE